MKDIPTLQLVLLPFLCAFNVCFGQIKINPLLEPSLSKPGFNLIFNDEFDSFQPTVWNRSVPGDDLEDYSDSNMCALREETPSNVSNVRLPTNGILKIRVRQGEDQNACSYSGGEIKSFSTQTSLRDWKILPNNYLEARVKVPECKGVGAAFWLYGATNPQRFMEVDMFELYGNEESKFQTNIHYGIGYPPTQPYWNNPTVVQVQDLDGDDLRLASQFLIFGVYHDNTKVEVSLNGVVYRTYYMHGYGNAGSNFFLRPVPFNIRLNSNSTPVGPSDDNPADCDNLPTYFQIDYVRVYQKTGSKTVNFVEHTGKMSLCANNQCYVQYCNDVPVNYYPGAIYEWDSTPFFGIQNISYSSKDVERFRFTVSPGTPPGIYPVNLTTTFNDGGYQEQLTLLIQVTSGTPPAPSTILIFNDNVQLYNFGVPINPNTTGYEWSVDGGQTWERVPNPAVGNKNIWPKDFVEMSSPYQVNVCVRAYTNCGVSRSYCANKTVPASDCPFCLMEMLSPQEVLVEEAAANLYRLKVKKSLYSQSYDWSFDQNYWYNVENTTDIFNYFGEFPASSAPFTIYVRGRDADTLTTVYSQDITFPQSLVMDGELTNNAEALYGGEIVEDRAAPNETKTLIASRFTLLNTLGQVILESEGNWQNFNDIRQKLPLGLYILVLHEEPSGKKSTRKILISNPRK